MKAAVSLPDDLFVWADKYAADNGLSRSALVAAALREYLEKHKNTDLTQRVNEAIERYGQPTDEAFLAAGRRNLKKVDW